MKPNHDVSAMTDVHSPLSLPFEFSNCGFNNATPPSESATDATPQHVPLEWCQTGASFTSPEGTVIKQAEESPTSAPSLVRTPSTCSDKCSQKTCSDCCGEKDCLDECDKSCAGFVDCDDENICTSPACTDGVCRDDPPPCFDEACLKGINLGYMSHLTEDGLGINSQSWPENGNESYASQLGHNYYSTFYGLDTPQMEYTYPPHKRRKSSYNNDFSQLATSTEDQFSNEMPFLCMWGRKEVCHEEFFNWNELDHHIFEQHLDPAHHILQQVPCEWDNCHQDTEVGSILSHVKRKHNFDEDVHVCLWRGCSETFPDHKDLEYHIQTAHIPTVQPVPLSCEWEQCGAMAFGARDLTTHLRTDHYTETLEGLAGNNGDEDVKERERTCAWVSDGADGDLPGSTCGHTFHNSHELQEHAKAVHISRLKKKTGYTCRWMGCTRHGTQPFSQKGKLERHLQVHTGFKACSCSICGKEFSAPQALQQHQRTHTGEKPYHCEICHKEFAQGSALTMHRRTHTKERPLKCDFPGCGKTFSESSNLSKHKKTHNAVGQHTCNAIGCNKTFHRLDQLKRHQKVHQP